MHLATERAPGLAPRLLVRPLGHSVDGISGPRYELSFAGQLERQGSSVSQSHGVVGLECLRIRSRPLRDDEEMLRIGDRATGSTLTGWTFGTGSCGDTAGDGTGSKEPGSKPLALGTARRHRGNSMRGVIRGLPCQGVPAGPARLVIMGLVLAERSR
jgi:hypothetical protein